MSFIAPIIISLLVAIDQITKILAINGLKNKPDIILWKGVFQLTYVENRGAAFGMLQNARWFLIIITVIILLVGWKYWKLIPHSTIGHWIKAAFVLIISGAIGNLIDRIFRTFVVDFFYFSLIDFPVFNIADICVVVGMILLVPLIFLSESSYINDEKQQEKEKTS